MKENGTIMIPIVAGYYYSIDNVGNHTLYYKYTKNKQEFGKKGVFTGETKEVVDIIGYYASMTVLLKACIKNAAFRQIESGEIETVKDYIESLERMSERIETVTGKY